MSASTSMSSATSVEQVAALVMETARRGELHHAIILHGPAPETLRDVALRIARTLNCLNGSAGGDDCTSCQRIERRLHPDVHVVEVGGEKKLISIEQIRELVGGANMRPYEGRTKVFIIDPADALSVSGSNSLLKTLEEPARDTSFVLLARSPDLLLPTIRSRSQAIYIGGEATVNHELAAAIDSLLRRFAEKDEPTALLTLAALVAQQDDVKDALSLLGGALRDAVAHDTLGIANHRLLAAADGVLAAVRGLNVNADARLLVEQALAELVA